MTFVPRNGVVAPAPAATALHPLPCGAVRLTSGFWKERQRINREHSIPHGMRQIRAAGGFDNFRNLADRVEGSHGHVNAIDGDAKNFVDTDVYKWLEAVGWEGVRGPLSDEVEAQAEEAIDLIVRAQDADGYLNTWYQTQPRETRFSNMGFGHELYCLGHLIQASIAHKRARGDTRLLDVARRFADLVVKTFGPSGREQVCGHPIIEMTLTELSRETGEPSYAETARLFIARRGHGLLGPGRFGSAYYQDRLPYLETKAIEGHAVRALYLNSGAVDVGVQFGDAALLETSRQQWQSMVTSKMHLTGGVGSRHMGESFGEPFELSPDRAYCETCASIAVVMWGWRLLLTERKGSVADIIERTLFNGVLSGVSQDGCAFNYVNPLQVRTQHPRQPWFEIACCPPNTMRTLASVDQYMATESDAGVQLHQYATAEIAGSGNRSLRMETDYPRDGRVRVVVTETAGGPWTLSLRIPAWAERAELSVNGQSRDVVSRDGYVEIERDWQAGDEVALDLHLSARLVYAPRIDAVQAAVAVERGPLVYCAEQADFPSGASMSDLRIDVSSPPSEKADARLPGGVEIDMTARVTKPEEGRWPYLPLTSAPPVQAGPVTHLRFIPYCSWGNREPGGMRVWLPMADSAG